MVGGDDYYALLGVEPDASAVELRRVWRVLALRWHPDRTGPSGATTFKKLSAAYSVLSDPESRAAYDRRRSLAGPRAAASRDRPPNEAAPSASPAAGAAPAPPPRRPAPGIMLARLSGPLNALLACGVARTAEDGLVELFLSSDEAASGGMVTIAMRVAVSCGRCALGPAPDCIHCSGSGITDELFSAWLGVSPGIADGTSLAPSAQLRGVIRPVTFRLRVSQRSPRP